MFNTHRGQVMLLQGPSSGGKSTFLHGANQDGHLFFALNSLLAGKHSSKDQLHILFNAIEIRDNDKVYDLLVDAGDPLFLKTKRTGSGKSWSVEGLKDVLVDDKSQVKALLEAIHKRLSVGNNGIHLGSSRSFAVFKMVRRVPILNHAKLIG